MVSLKLRSILNLKNTFSNYPLKMPSINEIEIKEDCFFILEIVRVGLGKLPFITDTQVNIQISSTPAFPYRMGSLVR